MKIYCVVMVTCLTVVNGLFAASALHKQGKKQMPLRDAIAQACKPGGSKCGPRPHAIKKQSAPVPSPVHKTTGRKNELAMLLDTHLAPGKKDQQS